MLGGILSLISAATFGLNNAAVRRGVLTGTVMQALIITVPIGIPLFFLGAALFGEPTAVAGFALEPTLLLAAAGILHFVIGRYGNYRGIKAVGGNLAGTIQQTSILYTLLFAVVFLGETFTPLRIFGIVLIFLGPLIMVRRSPKSAEQQRKTTFVPNYVEGWIFGILCALSYGMSPILIRAALENHGLGESLAGGTISYAAATVVIVLFLAIPAQRRHAFATDKAAVKWFIFSGIFVCLSQIFRYMALAVAPVTVVGPILQLQTIFRSVFAWLLNREHEVFDAPAIVGIVVSLIGALAVSVSTDFVLNLVPLPATLVDIAYWHWP